MPFDFSQTGIPTDFGVYDHASTRSNLSTLRVTRLAPARARWSGAVEQGVRAPFDRVRHARPPSVCKVFRAYIAHIFNRVQQSLHSLPLDRCRKRDLQTAHSQVEADRNTGDDLTGVGALEPSAAPEPGIDIEGEFPGNDSFVTTVTCARSPFLTSGAFLTTKGCPDGSEDH